jgi:hypothetical protein
LSAVEFRLGSRGSERRTSPMISSANWSSLMSASVVEKLDALSFSATTCRPIWLPSLP